MQKTDTETFSKATGSIGDILETIETWLSQHVLKVKAVAKQQV